MTRQPFCADCLKEKRANPNEKKYNSYCADHQYRRQRRYKHQRSARREYIYGFWGLLAPTASNIIRRNIAEVAEPPMLPAPPARSEPLVGDDLLLWLQELPKTFEYACCYTALAYSRYLSRDEEDEHIETFFGAREGTPNAFSVTDLIKKSQRPVVVTQEEKVVSYTYEITGADFASPSNPGGIRVILPDPVTRRNFRASGQGGPTTEQEPNYLQYYEMVHGHLPSQEVQAQYILLEAKRTGGSTAAPPSSVAPSQPAAATFVPSQADLPPAVDVAVKFATEGMEGLNGGTELTPEQTKQLRLVALRAYQLQSWTSNAARSDEVQARLFLPMQEAGHWVHLKPSDRPKQQERSQQERSQPADSQDDGGFVEDNDRSQLNGASAVSQVNGTDPLLADPLLADPLLADFDVEQSEEANQTDFTPGESRWGPPEE
jgi:hypothetical protein